MSLSVYLFVFGGKGKHELMKAFQGRISAKLPKIDQNIACLTCEEKKNVQSARKVKNVYKPYKEYNTEI